MTILVTGGAGFIGSHIVDVLIQQEKEVVVLDDLSGGFSNNVNPSAHFVQGSILDTNLVNQLFETHKFQYVYHLAAYAAENLSHFIRHYNYEVNVLGSINLINASVNNGVKCFVFMSSSGVYGHVEPPCSEETTPNPGDPYGIAKWTVEQDLKVANDLFGLQHIIFRPHNVYGERQNISDKYRNVVGIFLNQILKNAPLTIFGDGTQTRPFTYIKDIAPTIANCVSHPDAYNQTFNIGSDRVITLNELADHIHTVTKTEDNRVYLEYRKEVDHILVSHEKIQRFLPMEKETPLETGIAQMYAWAKQHGSQTPQEFGFIEIMQNLPPSWKPD